MKRSTNVQKHAIPNPLSESYAILQNVLPMACRNDEAFRLEPFLSAC